MPLLDALLLDPYPFHKWVPRRSDGMTGTGTLNDPLNAATADQFDKVMNSFAAMTVVHLGPGTFYTRGYYDAGAGSYGWQLQPKMRIIGSGVDVTTLQLSINVNADAHFYAIGHALSNSQGANLMDFAEISDLTIDCNASGQGPP